MDRFPYVVVGCDKRVGIVAQVREGADRYYGIKIKECNRVPRESGSGRGRGKVNYWRWLRPGTGKERKLGLSEIRQDEHSGELYILCQAFGGSSGGGVTG